MTFLHPDFLYFVLPPLFILFGFLLTQKESQENFFSEDVMSKLRVSANTLTLKARNALFLLMGFFMVIALAEPVIKDGVIEVKAKSADIMIALDISDSMLANDVYPNRLELAKQKALLLLDNAPNERIGIVAFAKSSYLVSPLSFDHSAVSFLLKQLDTSSITQKGTDYLSILDVIAKVKDVSEKKYLLIFTDGGDSDDFSKEIEYAKEKNIVVFVLGLGTQKGAPIKLKDGSFIKHHGDIIVSKLNENISELATKSGGVYIQNSTSSEDVLAMLKEIGNKSEEKELKSEEVPRYTPLFYYPLAMALLLLLIATSSLKRAVKPISTVFVLFALLFVVEDSKAGILDFMELDKAKKAYDSKEYEKSAQSYTLHAKDTNNAQSFYNAGNSFYKSENYDEALKSYEKAVFADENQKATNLSNIGNTHIKQAKEDSLQKAKKAYEDSLKLKEDKDTRENLREVKKLLEKQKQEQKEKDKQKENDKKDKDKKDDKNKDSKDSKDSDENKDKSDEDKESDKKKDDSKKEDKDSKESKDKESKKDKEQSAENNETKPQEKKEDLKKLDEQEKKDENQSASQPSSMKASAEKMSDAEAQKWLHELNKEKNTYMYKLDTQKPREEDTDEKPW